VDVSNLRRLVGLLLLPIFLDYQWFFVGSKVADLDLSMEYYACTRLKELQITELSD
jgi:hypothetical protein